MNRHKPTRKNDKTLPKEFENKVFTAKLIKPTEIKNAIDLTYNESVLKALLLQIEVQLEHYHFLRLSIIRESGKDQVENALKDVDTQVNTLDPIVEKTIKKSIKTNSIL